MNLSPAMKAAKAKMLRRRITAAEANLSAAHALLDAVGNGDPLALMAADRAATKLVELEAELEALEV